jgi:leader peptidase (prepilin peptidase) / N-methyltransferase
MLGSADLLDATPLSAVIVACALFCVAFQPPYAVMIWRDMRRAVRRRERSARTGGTIVTSAMLCGLFVVIAVVLRPAGSLLISSGVACVLLILAILDYRFYWLPDRLTIPLGIIGLLAAWPDEEAMMDAAIGAVVAGGAFYAIRVGYRMLRGVEGLGLGDVKFVAALGAWLGASALPWLVLLASVTALTVEAARAFTLATRPQATARSPFGLHLALAGWAMICLRQSLFGV